MSTPSPIPATGGRLLLQGMVRSRRRLSVYVAGLSAWQVSEALVPVLIGVVIDRAVATGDLGALALWLGALVLLFAVLSTSYRVGARFGFRVAQEETHRLRSEIARTALHPRGVRSGLLPGEVLSLATSDTEEIGFAYRTLGYAVASTLAIGVSAVALVRIDLVLGLAVLAGVPTVLVLIQLVTPVIARRARTHQAALARASGVATDLVRGFRTLKGIGAEDAAATRYRGASGRARDAGVRAADSYGVVSGLTTAAAALFLAVVTLLAGVLAVEGRISIGELIAIVGLTQFLAEPMRILGDLLAELASARASAQRIVDYLGSPPLVTAGTQDRPGGSGPSSLSLSGLRAGSLHDVTVASRPGELLGMAVTDPADAVALVGVLQGEQPGEDPGAVMLDGVPLGGLTIAARRESLLVAPHLVDLFEGTLADNIDPERRHSEPALTELVAAAAVADVAALHPDGLARAVTPDGATYSGGQRQRVAYARALATRAPVLVLHEPTTAVDAVTEHRMAAGLRAVRHGTGQQLVTWVVTSSPALLAQADRVVLVSGGRVVAEGTHAELCGREDYRAAVLR